MQFFSNAIQIPSDSNCTNIIDKGQKATKECFKTRLNWHSSIEANALADQSTWSMKNLNTAVWKPFYCFAAAVLISFTKKSRSVLCGALSQCIPSHQRLKYHKLVFLIKDRQKISVNIFISYPKEEVIDAYHNARRNKWSRKEINGGRS